MYELRYPQISRKEAEEKYNFGEPVYIEGDGKYYFCYKPLIGLKLYKVIKLLYFHTKSRFKFEYYDTCKKVDYILERLYNKDIIALDINTQVGDTDFMKYITYADESGEYRYIPMYHFWVKEDKAQEFLSEGVI